MNRKKKWPFYTILVVFALTLYNIFPTIFYYSKPLKDPVDSKKAAQISRAMLARVNHLEEDALAWLRSFCSLLDLQPARITQEHPESITIEFKTHSDAELFRTHLPRAGALMPFVPSQLSLQGNDHFDGKKVTVQRQIPIHFDLTKTDTYCQFSKKFDEEGLPTPLYRALIEDRALSLVLSLGGSSESAQILKGRLVAENKEQEDESLMFMLCRKILAATKIYGESSPVTQRIFASFAQCSGESRKVLIQSFKSSLEALLASSSQDKEVIQETLAILKRNFDAFVSGPLSFDGTNLPHVLPATKTLEIQEISLEGRNPFITAILIDWKKESIILKTYPDLHLQQEEVLQNASSTHLSDLADQLLYNEIAITSRVTSEKIIPYQDHFVIALSSLAGSHGFVAMRLAHIAETEAALLKNTLLENWNPKYPDLSRDNFPIYDYATYLSLPPEKQNLCLVIYAPSLQKTRPLQGMRMHSIYVIAKGLGPILHRIQNEAHDELTQQFIEDFSALRSLLDSHLFFGFSGASFGLDPSFAHDFVFEKEDYYQMVLKATREDFSVHGSKRFAILELTDLEQRILTENRIDTRIHEDLLKQRDDYLAAQLKVKGLNPLDIPKPTKNVYWNNLKLSAVKYFRGDDRKILHWGLDLSGGKTVQIELRDLNHRAVTSETALKQGVNELYTRVNKMGVSEVSIRQEGNYITLDFPGSQGLSATDLVKASSMYFHVVNEKFTPSNPALAQAVNGFLQDIWNEAVVTNRKTIEEIQLIAWKHLHGNSLDPEHIEPRSEAAQTLYSHGLRLAPPDLGVSSTLSDLYSQIALFRGDDIGSWQGQTHPLLLVFRNFALEGAHLDQIQAGYDPSKGNFLSFTVKGSVTREGTRLSPQGDLYAWTSLYAKEKILGTPLEKFSSGRGWRMAVILNGSIISSPTLDSPLRDSAMITGSFTQREITSLEADLKAGSLSFTPTILSEKNVSPELGQQERFHGVLATILSLILVVAVLISYYRFAGVVASMTVLFTLLLLWATLQNLQATMTLAGLAGIILTLGMAVDANVLVFERIREEFYKTGRIASAVHEGYKKAFSAIIDSNVTTLIAAMILLHFDSGPIKGFAVTLIIGIIASVFASIFTARFFFAHWVQDPRHHQLKMLHFFHLKQFNFLKYTKITVICSAIIIFVGAFVLIQERKSLFGMDFTGGYALNCEIEGNESNTRALVEQALIQAGAKPQEIQIRELNTTNSLRIFLSRALSEKGHPFYGLPLENPTSDIGFPYESNPKIVWVVSALKSAHLSLSPHTLQDLNKNWTEVSGQMSDTMRNNALIGLTIALLCILLYITIRFEFKYAISATICLAHDLFFTLGVMALLHACNVAIQIDLNTITALMTMIGYSLNDTIIVFDRIREENKLMRKSSFTEIINHALNVTLSRTLLTSGTTLLILLPLLLLGGSTLFGFSLVMAIGVIFGTLSSLFIAAPLMKYFHDRGEKKPSKFIIEV